MTQQQKLKISESKKGKKLGKDNPFYGKTHTREAREKISKSKKGKPGHPISNEAKKKISESKKGKPRSKECKRKVSESKKGKQLGKDNPFFGKTHTEETKKKLSESNKGNDPWNKGKVGVYSEKTLRKIGEAIKGNDPWNKGKVGVYSEKTLKQMSESRKEKFKDPDFLDKFKHFHTNKFNTKEKKLMTLLNEDFKFVGDFSIWIDGKNPDFINEERKMVIEHFGSYWHGEKFRQSIDDFSTNEEHELQRIQHFEKNGYKCLVIWEHELKDIDKLKEKIKNFMER
jgi:G:T-mismatch repair DNA endonuclease (very short patch repair protein)